MYPSLQSVNTSRGLELSAFTIGAALLAAAQKAGVDVASRSSTLLWLQSLLSGFGSANSAIQVVLRGRSPDGYTRTIQYVRTY